MSNGIRVSARLMKALQDGFSIAVTLIEGLPPGQTIFEPQTLLIKGEDTSIAVIWSADQSNIIEMARKEIAAKSREIDIYALSYSVYQDDDNGHRIDAVMLEVGEQGGAGNLMFVQPFQRGEDGKAIMLTDGPLMQGVGPSILLPQIPPVQGEAT